MKKIYRLTALITLFMSSVMAQNDIVNIVPLSPNAAAISKFGEIPVSNFTGVPNIGVPIYTLKSGSLELPLSLNYHAGGVKVESIASWVGLSWSLSGMPSISRSVMGAPDDNANGYFHFRKSVREYISHYTVGEDSLAQELMHFVRSEGEDTEPDIFNFNLGNKSGKFYFNQDQSKFFSDPHSNIKIEYLGGNFRITDDDGAVYLFTETETTATSGSTAGSPVKTSWLVTEIVSADLRDSITFTYATEHQISTSLIAQTKYVPLINSYCLALPDLVTGGQLTTVVAKTPLSIVSKNGRIDFVKGSSQREDLVGGYPLEKILISDPQLNLIRQFGFGYKYLTGLGGIGCFSNDAYRSNKWKLLSKVAEISADGADTLKHTFTYNESVIPPCRNSAAQDYWGYFNGALDNTNLLPSVRIPTVSPPVYTDGADRTVNPAYTQFAILKQINYPSGGHTKFEYENNDTGETDIPKMYKNEMAYVAQELPVDENNPLPVTNEYETTFVIDNQPDPVLNGNALTGGAMVSGEIENLGVPFGATGAQISITRMAPGTPTVITYPSGSFSNYYLQNGTYKLTATFNQNPPNYQNFWAILSYKSIDTTYLNSFLGGLRVKKVETFDGPSATPMIRDYSYVESHGGTLSSGQSFLKPLFKYSYALVVGSGNCGVTVLKIRSFSNQAQVTSSGSYVGYRKVFVSSNGTNENGLSSYVYSLVPDSSDNQEVWPFPPAQSMAHLRGQLLEQRDYRASEIGLVPVKSSSFAYQNIMDTVGFYAIKTSSEKFEHTPWEVGWPKFVAYEFHLGWSALSKQTERLYDQADTTRYVETVTDFLYDTPYRQLAEKTNTTSRGEVLSTKLHYPYDLSLTGDPEAARLWLLSKNNIAAVLKTESRLQGQLVQGQLTNYKKFDGLNLVRPAESISYQSNPADNKTLYFDRYDNYGNLLEAHADLASKTVYLWSYGGRYPIAELKNTDYLTVAGVLGGQPSVDNIATAHPSASQLAGYFSTLRNSTLLKDAHISTFVHRPLIGLDLQTDAKGMSTQFGYDSFGRLATLKDHFGNLVKSYDYHYRTAGSATLYQNTVHSQTFTRNNCGAGYAGGEVLYTVAANTYSSAVSQAAADALAIADIAANGQNYANSNGTCVPASTCKLFRLTIPVSVSSNLYIRYRECGSSSYGVYDLNELEMEVSEDNEYIFLYLNIEGSTSDFEFRYGANGASQVIGSIIIEEV